MKLKTENAELFYEMFLPLLNYVNESYHVTMESVNFTGESVDPRDAAQVAHFLWERIWIINDYVAENALHEEQREIILSWKRCISGTFIIERHLKKGSVFIDTDNNSVYMVNGIIDSWEEMFLGVPTPIIVKATLLPFRDVIISDGLVSAYRVRFGKNSAAEFKDTYMTAKKNKKIITRI
jgi:hypothetical protein